MSRRPAKAGKRTPKGREAQLKRMAETGIQQPAAPARTSTVVESPVAAYRAEAAAAAAAAREVTRTEEYAFIKADLQRVGILAGAMFAILAGLTFFLR